MRWWSRPTTSAKRAIPFLPSKSLPIWSGFILFYSSIFSVCLIPTTTPAIIATFCSLLCCCSFFGSLMRLWARVPFLLLLSPSTLHLTIIAVESFSKHLFSSHFVHQSSSTFWNYVQLYSREIHRHTHYRLRTPSSKPRFSSTLNKVFK